MTEAVDYERVLADMEARKTAFIQQIDAAMAGIRAVLAMTGGAVPVGPSGPPASYMGLGLLEAVKLCLQRSKRPLTNAEIGQALEAGGFIHNSVNFTNTINTALWRAEKESGSEVVRRGKTWVLREWAPGIRSSRGREANGGADEPERAEGEVSAEDA